MIDRLEAEAQLGEIQARRDILFSEHRSAVLPEAEFFEKLRRLDSEEQYWRVRIKADETPQPPMLPTWGQNLRTQMLTLSANVDAWRDERRAERLIDVTERREARERLDKLFFGLFVWMGLLTAAGMWLALELVR